MRREKSERRREKKDGEGHWLGEGLDGQESLLLELDPFLYRADRTLCQLIKAHFFDLREQGMLPADNKGFALYCPPEDAVGWHIGFLSEFFRLSLLAAERDALQEEVCARFDVEILDSGIPPGREGCYHLFLHSGSSWEDLDRFRSAVRFFRSVLAPGGLCIFLLQGSSEQEEESILWHSGPPTALRSLENGEIFLLEKPAAVSTLNLAEVLPSDEEYLQAFLRRHRAYIGKAAKGACLARMNDEEFSEAYAFQSRQRSALLLRWAASSGTQEKLL
jgi:hypothetical protein